MKNEKDALSFLKRPRETREREKKKRFVANLLANNDDAPKAKGESEKTY